MEGMAVKNSILIFLTHALSASGAIIGMLAVEAVYSANWELVFLWLGLALVIDGIDGPIARLVGTHSMPRFSGARIDLIVDYLNYVFVPAIALVKVAILPEVPSLVFAGLILVSSLFHFSDTQSKAVGYSFIGFPAIWNVVIFYLFVFQPAPVWTVIVLIVFIILTFIPFRWSHPFRNGRFRVLTLIMTLVGAIAAVWILLTGFSSSPAIAQFILGGGALYGLGLVVLNATIWRDHSDNHNSAGGS